ncbi:MAG: hypothetical protein ACRDSZ_22100 [Pseudonocardiaceae bacterium]
MTQHQVEEGLPPLPGLEARRRAWPRCHGAHGGASRRSEPGDLPPDVFDALAGHVVHIARQRG